MITVYAVIYLLFIMLAALLSGLLVTRFGVPSLRSMFIALIIFILAPLIFGYFYIAYFSSLPEITVPDVRGMSLEAARSTLSRNSLLGISAGSIFDTRYQEGTVALQKPEAGRKVKIGRIINLMFSSGKRKVITPNLLGRQLSQAEVVLVASDLRLGTVKKENNSDAPDGTVMAQEPLPGEEVEIGRLVDVLISTTLEVSEGGNN